MEAIPYITGGVEQSISPIFFLLFINTTITCSLMDTLLSLYYGVKIYAMQVLRISVS